MILDCSDKPSEFPMGSGRVRVLPGPALHRVYIEDVEIKESRRKLYYISLENIFKYIRTAWVQNAAVLLTDEKGGGLAYNLAIACLIEFNSMGLLSALLHLRRIFPRGRASIKFLDLI